MSKLIRAISNKRRVNQPATTTIIECNYSNNYYGDQVCRMHTENAQTSVKVR